MTTAPYPGLRPYDENERENFFGRAADSKILIDQILANRLTLLFAATGVGKSSLLKASVIPRLKEPLGENLDVVFFNDWVAPPLPNLKRVILETLHEQGDLEQGVIEQEVVDAPLSGFLEFCCLFTSQPFLIVLDQFEEFFRYRGNYAKEHSQALIDQLTDVILNKAIPVGIVLSMREDYALELNDFKPKLPMILFENYYRLEKLTREAAKDAILIPAERVGFKYEDVLFEMLLKDLLSRDLDRSKGSMVADTIETVEPPYLQIICSQLWQRDKNDPEKTIRFATYEKAGYAKGLLDNFIGKDVMSKFSFQEKQLASKSFDHLVSRRGTKMPHTVEDLSQMLNANPDELRKVLDKLEQNRVLRRQQREKKVWYELYHDMFSHSIDDWNTAWKNRMRARRTVIGLASAGVIGAVLLVGYDTWVNASSTHLRMSLSDPYSMVELWQGEKGSLDIFGQQKFLAQIDMSVKDREPDKRLPLTPVSENNNLVGEGVGALALEQRVAAFSNDGQYKKALTVAKVSIADTDTELSRKMVTSLGQNYTAGASDLLFDKLRYIGDGDLKTAIQLELSSDRLAYWLKDKEAITTKLSAGHTQQKIAIIDKLPHLALEPKELVAMLLPQLKDSDRDVRSSVADALGQLGSAEALPALLSQLKDSDRDVRSSVASALGQLGSADALPVLVAQLKDDDSDVRSSVASALGQLGSADALPALVSQLKDSEWNVRRSVASALGELGSAEALPALVSQLKDSEWNVRRSVASALGELGSAEALPALVSQLKDSDSGVRQSVASALGELGSAEALPALVSQLKDSDRDVRSSVASALGELGSAEALPVLLSQLKDSDRDVRSSVASALGELGSAEALPALLSQLKDSEWNVRRSVASALGQLGSAEALPALLSQLKDSDGNVRQSVASALGELGSADALPALVSQLKDSEWNVRSSVASALGELGSAEALPVLLSQLKDSDWNVRQSVASALGELGSAEALPALLSQLKDSDSGVRQSVASALGQLGGAEALPALVSQLKDSDSDVRRSVASALGQLGNAEALPALLSQLKDSEWNVRRSVASALGQLGSADALPALVSQLKDSDSDVRRSVASALGQLGSAEALPALVSQLKDGVWNVRRSVASALGQLGSAEALPALVSQLKDSDRDVRSSVADALGQLGSAEALPALVSQLKDSDGSVRSSVASALAKLNVKEALPALSTLFEQGKKSEKIAPALGLLRFGETKAYEYLLKSMTDPRTQADVLYLIQDNESDAVKKLLLEQFHEKYPIPVQVNWIEAFATSGTTKALPLLYRLSDSSNGRIKSVAKTAISKLETDYDKLLAMAENPELRVSLRLQALTTLVEKHQQKAIPDLTRLLKADKKFYGRKIWRMLGELKAPEAKELLEARIEEIRQGYATWRDIRDSEPQVAEEETKEQNPAWKQWKEKLDASKPAYAVHYAQALARLDPETGIKLLQHEIADIRKGAWYGLVSLGDINLVKKLTDLRLNSQDNPLLRHAAYRAIDLSLTTIQHNNKPEDLQALEAWYPTLKQQEMQQEEVKTEDELSITPRVDWTIHQISYNLKAKAELQRRYQVFVAEQKTGTNTQNP